MRAQAPTSTRKTGARPRAAVGPTRAANPAAKGEKLEVRILASYSHVDKEVQRRLETHVAPPNADNVSTWFDGDTNAGDSSTPECRAPCARPTRSSA